MRKVVIKSKIKGATEAEGLVVIIDVLRACTSASILFHNQAEKIIPVRSISDAADYQQNEYVLVGEGAQGKVSNIFDFNNSPSELIKERFHQKTIVMRSNNATKAIVSAQKARQMILGSFVNLQSVVDYLNQDDHPLITLVPLGRLGKRGTEDEWCAKLIAAELKEEKLDFREIEQEVRNCSCARLVSEELGRPLDVELALALNKFPNVPRVDLSSQQKAISLVD